MKILSTADWHLGNYVGPQCDSPIKRMENTIKCLNALVNAARAELPDIILVAGDIFHQARVWSDRALTEVQIAALYLNKLADIGQVCVLYGTPNHDGQQQFETLQQMTAGVMYYGRPEIKQFVTPFGPIQIAGLPGFDKGHFRAQYPGLSAEQENVLFTEQLSMIIAGLSAQVNPEIPSVLMAHHTVVGCELDNGQHVFQANEVVLEAGALDNSAFDLVCMGHIHKAQRVEACNKPVYYSGSIDAFTFNDEGHEHGFWMFDIDDERFVISGFKPTPAREFLTCRWNSESVKTYIDAGVDGFARFEKIENRIVRVLYECDSETEKALNKKQLEKGLYTAGAYYVSEIRPEKITASVNKERMHESLTVWDCLRRYLTEKKVIGIGGILKVADDIISKAEASQPAGGQTGVFLPLEIEVRNYRSYAEEKLSFQDIYFAMVNGRNGSGKSSLFMDAPLDCLYEQPREGELTGWIRNGEKSGSISFTFQLGESVYRVVRTRQKSGKATLALAKGIVYFADFGEDREGESGLKWEDQSCERMTDTQQKIVQLLGMDADTFRSCVLIMQDQYGRFMEAKPEDRMSVLASLLGLGVYEQLENSTKDILRESNRELKNLKDDASILEAEISVMDTAKQQCGEVKGEIENGRFMVQGLKDELETVRNKLVAIENAELELLQVNKDVDRKVSQKNEKQNKLSDLRRDIKSTEDFLKQEPELTAAHEECQKLQGSLIALGEQEKQAVDKRRQMEGIETENTRLNNEHRKVQNDILTLQKRLNGLPRMTEELNKYDGVEQQLKEMDGKQIEYERLLDERYEAMTVLRQAEDKLKNLSRQVEILNDSQCLDINNANCIFLREAKSAKEFLPDVKGRVDEYKKRLATVESKIRELGYFSDDHLCLKKSVQKYRELSQSVQSCEADKRMIDIHTERLQAIRFDIGEKNKFAIMLSDELDKLNVSLGELQTIRHKVNILSGQDKLYMQLPQARAYLENALLQVEDLENDISGIAVEIGTLMGKMAMLGQSIQGADEVKVSKGRLEEDLYIAEGRLSVLNRHLGGIEEKLRSLEGKQEEQKKIVQAIKQAAERVARLTVLSEAFGQDGIPHQIIRDIIPELEASANEILGQMTGGRMRLEFRTERTLKSNKAKEVATLDIVIIDVDNGELPYLARSGGQKVRAALAVSFSLAMVKASRVGLQLGMMFVDEPPFLDAEGIEAYCLALESIHNKYPEMRIVAISHDQEMKARFPQQISIVETENGSKVRWA